MAFDFLRNRSPFGATRSRTASIAPTPAGPAANAAPPAPPTETQLEADERRTERARDFHRFLAAMTDGSAIAKYGRLAGLPAADTPRPRPALVSTAGDPYAAAQAEQREREAGGPWPAGSGAPATAGFILGAAARARGEDAPAEPEETDPRENDGADDAETARKRKKKKAKDEQPADEDQDETDDEKAARARERRRCAAIMQSEHGKRFVIAAAYLAIDTELPVAVALSLLTTMASSMPAPGRADLGARMREQQNPDVGADGGAAPTASANIASFIIAADKKRRGEQ